MCGFKVKKGLPADWAIKEALKRAGLRDISYKHVKCWPAAYPAHLELARMIEKFEKPPVSNARRRARELFGEVYPRLSKPVIDSGEFDDDKVLLIIEKALREIPPVEFDDGED